MQDDKASAALELFCMIARECVTEFASLVNDSQSPNNKVAAHDRLSKASRPNGGQPKAAHTARGLAIKLTHLILFYPSHAA